MKKLNKKKLISVPENLQFYWKYIGYPNFINTSPCELILFDDIKVLYNSDILGELKIECSTDMVKITYKILDFILLLNKNDFFQFNISFIDKNNNIIETVEIFDKKLFKKELFKKARNSLNYWVIIHISIKTEKRSSDDVFTWIEILDEQFAFYTIACTFNNS